MITFFIHESRFEQNLQQQLRPHVAVLVTNQCNKMLDWMRDNIADGKLKLTKAICKF